MNSTKLQIQPHPSKENQSQKFNFIGTMDVDAIPLLETLYVLPDNCAIELDFAQLDRINSMGLAQLLKLFEHWQKQNNSIRVINVNRMINVLFKMTGLTRFLSDTSSAQPIEKPIEANKSENKIIGHKPVNAAPATADTASLLAPANDAPLQIQPAPTAESLSQQFDFIGVIDINCIPVLETLYILPEQCHATLDFARLQRINSMGLAQLLKLFEHWQKRNISISVINVNRMIGVLFKMTGLTRFLSTGPDKPLTSTPINTQPIQEVKTPVAPVISSSISASQPEIKAGKLKLWVSAQSSQQMNGWYFFNTYLQRHLNREVHLELIHGAVNEQQLRSIEQMDIVFTKPFEATRLLLEHNFQPILRPIDQTDEVTLLVRADDQREHLTEYLGGKVVTAARDNFVYLLGRFLLEQDDESLENMEYVFSGHDIKALQMLLKHQADILFMLSDTYQGLSGLSKKMLRKVDQSETAFAFHLFNVAPNCHELANGLSEVLLNMSMDSQGRQVLADLGIHGWIKPTPDEIDMLVMLFKRYAL